MHRAPTPNIGVVDFWTSSWISGVYLLALEPGKVYGRADSSCQRMWKLVGDERDSRWKCEARLENMSKPAALGKNVDQ